MSEHSWPFRMGPFFDHVANQYDGVQVSNIDDGKGYYVAIAEPIEPTDDVVDVWSIGAGTGLDLVSILKRIPNARVNCVDVAPKMLERLRNRFAKTTVDIRTRVGSFLDLDFAPGCCDYLLASATLHHFTHDEKSALLPRLARALKPGGKLVVGDLYVDETEAAIRLADYERCLAEGYDVKSGGYHIDIPMTEVHERELLAAAGFSNVEVIWRSSNYSIIVAMV